MLSLGPIHGPETLSGSRYKIDSFVFMSVSELLFVFITFSALTDGYQSRQTQFRVFLDLYFFVIHLVTGKYIWADL